MWQAIAEVVKQGIRNIANSGKNAQVNGSTAQGGVGLINPDFKKSDAKSENNNDENSVSQTTENTTEVETTKQEAPAESNEGKSSGGSGLQNIGSLLGGKNTSGGSDISGASSSASSDASSSASSGATVTSDKNTKNAKDVSSDTKDSSTDTKDSSTDTKDSSSDTKETNWEKADKFRKNIGERLNKAGSSAQIDGSVATLTPISPTIVSDERLKDIFGEETPIDCFAKIHSYEFKYTPEAQEMMQGKNHVDDKEHLGVMAQELLMNPATSACVIKDTDGFLKVDTAQLTMANTATIAELSRKVQQLEQMLGER